MRWPVERLLQSQANEGVSVVYLQQYRSPLMLLRLAHNLSTSVARGSILRATVVLRPLCPRPRLSPSRVGPKPLSRCRGQQCLYVSLLPSLKKSVAKVHGTGTLRGPVLVLDTPPNLNDRKQNEAGKVLGV